jgi:hypothetical protein
MVQAAPLESGAETTRPYARPYRHSLPGFLWGAASIPRQIRFRNESAGQESTLYFRQPQPAPEVSRKTGLGNPAGAVGASDDLIPPLSIPLGGGALFASLLCRVGSRRPARLEVGFSTECAGRENLAAHRCSNLLCRSRGTSHITPPPGSAGGKAVVRSTLRCEPRQDKRIARGTN